MWNHFKRIARTMKEWLGFDDDSICAKCAPFRALGPVFYPLGNIQLRCQQCQAIVYSSDSTLDEQLDETLPILRNYSYRIVHAERRNGPFDWYCRIEELPGQVHFGVTPIAALVTCLQSACLYLRLSNQSNSMQHVRLYPSAGPWVVYIK